MFSEMGRSNEMRETTQDAPFANCPLGRKIAEEEAKAAPYTNYHFIPNAYDNLAAQLEASSADGDKEELEILKDAKYSLDYSRSAVCADADCATAIAQQLVSLKGLYFDARLEESKEIILAIRKDVCELLSKCASRIQESMSNPALW